MWHDNLNWGLAYKKRSKIKKIDGRTDRDLGKVSPKQGMLSSNRDASLSPALRYVNGWVGMPPEVISLRACSTPGR